MKPNTESASNKNKYFMKNIKDILFCAVATTFELKEKYIPFFFWYKNCAAICGGMNGYFL